VESVPLGVTRDEVVKKLQGIWEDAFQIKPIDLHNNFYELGGNPRFADEIFGGIDRVFGRRLPSVTVTHSPTIAALAEILLRPEPPQFSPLIQIKTGWMRPPVFMAHGMSGLVEFYRLARQIETAHPVYGLQGRGLDGLASPLDRVEDMASYYLESLIESHPTGPLTLVGYSFGGLVALEMAQQLIARGRHVSQLIMVDAFPHPRFLSRTQRALLAVQRVRGHAANMRQMPTTQAFSYFKHGLQRRLPMSSHEDLPDAPPTADKLTLAVNAPRVKEKAYEAYGNYCPRHYPGVVRFITTSQKSFFPQNPAPIWDHLVEGIEVDVIPGDHLNIVCTEFRPLATLLTRYLTEPPTSKPPARPPAARKPVASTTSQAAVVRHSH
jgi:acetoacetyl-CoA synthetase